MNIQQLDRIKRLTISALVSDDHLMGILVLKGGNALDLAYDITNRGSIDIDFSMESDFSKFEKEQFVEQISYLLDKEFGKEKLKVFDVRFSQRPEKIDDSIKDFWGGYQLEFKIIEQDTFEKFRGNIDDLRRNAITIDKDNSRKYVVDISRYEYIGRSQPREINGSVVQVYSPEMLAIEKLRALCQQVEEYRIIVHKMNEKSRARDFYDIYNLSESFQLDFRSSENVQLLRDIFDAKKVPISYIDKLPMYRDHHEKSWELVLQTINPEEIVMDFDFYFDYVLDKFRPN